MNCELACGQVHTVVPSVLVITIQTFIGQNINNNNSRKVFLGALSIGPMRPRGPQNNDWVEKTTNNHSMSTILNVT